MGYTHYWKTAKPIPLKTWQLICDDAEKIIAASPVPLAWEYDEPKKVPEVKRQNADGGAALIRFNGVEDDGHETFFFEQAAQKFAFCETANKPYDVVVTAVLAAIADWAWMVKVSSDGDLADWQDGLELAKKALGRELTVDLGRD
jgi:hypothetical protein